MSERLLLIRIYSCHISGWFLVNVIAAILPIFAIVFFPDYAKNNVFSGLLVYALTFLITGLYLFTVIQYRFYSLERLFFWLITITAIVIASFYVYFNFTEISFIENNFKKSIVFLLLVSSIFGFYLHWGDLKDEIEGEFNEKRKESADKVKKNVQGMKGEIQNGGS